jgi:hypothetical protein
MKTELHSETEMLQSSEHPSEEKLERFLLHQVQGEELEELESHVLVCHQCIEHLEDLELTIAATKMALADLHQQTVAENVARESKPKFSWLGLRSLSFVGATAAIALAVTLAPRFTPVEKEMSAFRGAENNTLPAGRPINLSLNARDLPETPVSVEVVNADGNEVWNGNSSIDHQIVKTQLPAIDKGNYLLRLYAGNGKSHGELLREFSFDVQ